MLRLRAGTAPFLHLSEATEAMTATHYNDKVVRQFAIMTVVWGIVGMLVGVLIAAQLLWPDLLPVGRDTALLLGFLGIIAGFVTLVWRLRPGDDDDDIDPDDGAKV